MATIIHALGDTIKVDRAFISGKERVTVNGKVVFEGRLRTDTLQRFRVGNRGYGVKTKLISEVTDATAVFLKIYENRQVIHSAVYDQSGRPVRNEEEVLTLPAIHVWGTMGALIGAFGLMAFQMFSNVLPSGTLGGAVGGIVGYALGFWVYKDK